MYFGVTSLKFKRSEKINDVQNIKSIKDYFEI